MYRVLLLPGCSVQAVLHISRTIPQDVFHWMRMNDSKLQTHRHLIMFSTVRYAVPVLSELLYIPIQFRLYLQLVYTSAAHFEMLIPTLLTKVYTLFSIVVEPSFKNFHLKPPAFSKCPLTTFDILELSMLTAFAASVIESYFAIKFPSISI